LNKKVLYINVTVLIISLIIILRGLFLVTNSGLVAYEMLYHERYERLVDFIRDTATSFDYFVDVVKTSGILISVFGIFSLLLSFRNLNKELTNK